MRNEKEDFGRVEFHGRVARHRHSALVAAAITIAFAVRHLIGDTGISRALFSIAELLLLLVALYNINVDD